MKTNLVRFALSILVLAGAASRPAMSFAILKKPFQQRYDYRSVTCYACHANGKDEQGKRLPKEVLNDLGEQMQTLMAKRRVAERIEAAKHVDSDARKKVYAEISSEFVELLKQLEKMKSPSGAPWGQVLKEGKIEGVKKKTR